MWSSVTGAGRAPVWRLLRVSLRMAKKRTIRVDTLARVEGEGALTLEIRNGVLEEARLEIFEPPRFFEALLRGRRYDEVADITARICGICPVAYQMTAVHAVEGAMGVAVSESIRRLRRLLYCGEWIESHCLHVFLLHAPDFLGFDDAIEMAREHGEVVRRGLRLKQVGNRILRVLGGREVHPINVRVGGFHRVPRRAELQALRDDLEWAREAAVASLRWAATLPFPDFDRDDECVALRPASEYPFNEGPVASNRGLRIEASEFETTFEEEQVPHSTALQARRGGRVYQVGPAARFRLNRESLSPTARATADEVGLGDARNPYASILVRLVEVLHAVEEALDIVDDEEAPPEAPSVQVRPGVGYSCTEAPRGLLYHAYEIDEAGIIRRATIIPPTSQKQAAIEGDLRAFAEDRLNWTDDELRRGCEQIIRNHDPCISCATHFLDLRVHRR